MAGRKPRLGRPAGARGKAGKKAKPSARPKAKPKRVSRARPIKVLFVCLWGEQSSLNRMIEFRLLLEKRRLRQLFELDNVGVIGFRPRQIPELRKLLLVHDYVVLCHPAATQQVEQALQGTGRTFFDMRRSSRKNLHESLLRKIRQEKGVQARKGKK